MPAEQQPASLDSARQIKDLLRDVESLIRQEQSSVRHLPGQAETAAQQALRLTNFAIICIHLILAASTIAAEKPGPLPQTTFWDFPQDIVDEQYRELRDFYERQIRDAASRREAFSHQSPGDQRKRLRELTGAIDQP